MRLIRLIILIGLFLFLPYKVVFASSSFSYPTDCTGDFANCSNGYTTNQEYATFNRTTTDGIANYSGFNLTTGSPITGVTVKTTGHYIGGASIHNLLISFTGLGNLSAGCSTAYTITLTGDDVEYTNYIQSSCFYQHTLVPEDFDTDTQLNLTTSSNGSMTYYIDSVQLQINYNSPISTLTINSSEASPSGQFVSLNLSGETATISSTLQCSVRLLERCTKPGFAGWLSPSAVATIFLDASYTGNNTVDIGGGFYKGFGWGGTDYTWEANNIHVPYNPDASCDYPYSIICSDNHEMILYEDYSENPNLVATPSAGITSTEYTEPEPTNPLSWLIWKIRQLAFDLFIPHDNVIKQESEYINGLVQTKAPLAYGNAVLALNWSTGSISTATPTINISLTANNNGLLPNINWTPPDFFLTAMNTIRGALAVVLWLSFILYLIIRVRSIFV